MNAEQKGCGEGRDPGERSGEAVPEAWMDMCRGMMTGTPDCCGAQAKTAGSCTCQEQPSKGEAGAETSMDSCRGMMARGMPECCGPQMKRMMAAFQAAPETKSAAGCCGGAS